MRIINYNNRAYIDKPLFDYVTNIWMNLSTTVSNGSSILFAKNSTVPRLITDYAAHNISRVVKKEKADYLILSKISLRGYPHYYDNVTNTICEDDTKEVVFGIYNLSAEDQGTIEQILWFTQNSPKISFINEDILNDILNNGFVLDNDNYVNIRELVNSEHSDNHNLAVNMLTQSNLKENWQWIVYLFFGKFNYIQNYDKKQLLTKYLQEQVPSINLSAVFSNYDTAMSRLTNPDVKHKFLCLMNKKFNEAFKAQMKALGSEKFVLQDFKLEYQ